MASIDDDYWSPQTEQAYQKFKRMFEGYRALAGPAALRSNLQAFREVNEHHRHMVPILDRLEKELLGAGTET